MPDEAIINFADKREAVQFCQRLMRLDRPHRVEWTRYAPRRSDRQNRWYWPCFVAPFAQYLRDQGEAVTDLQAHEMLKQMFLRKTVVDKTTGEAFDFTQSSAALNTAEFNEYLDKVAFFLADTFHFIVPEPSQYRERDDASTGAAA